MKLTLMIFLVLAQSCDFGSSVPVNTSQDTAGKIAEGVFSHLAALPLFGPLWLNSVIAKNRLTDLKSTPPGFVPVSVATGQSLWGSDATVPISISYVLDARITNNGTDTFVGIYVDKDMWVDTEIEAIDLDVTGATAIPAGTTEFTRNFECHTGDRIVEDERVYLFIKVRGDVKADVLSDRFTTIDNRLTSNVAGAFFEVYCAYQNDQYGAIIPPRKETLFYSDPLPIPPVNPVITNGQMFPFNNTSI